MSFGELPNGAHRSPSSLSPRITAGTQASDLRAGADGGIRTRDQPLTRRPCYRLHHVGIERMFTWTTGSSSNDLDRCSMSMLASSAFGFHRRALTTASALRGELDGRSRERGALTCTEAGRDGCGLILASNGFSPRAPFGAHNYTCTWIILILTRQQLHAQLTELDLYPLGLTLLPDQRQQQAFNPSQYTHVPHAPFHG